jgi:phospholipid transport system substrate-binding protein
LEVTLKTRAVRIGWIVLLALTDFATAAAARAGEPIEVVRMAGDKAIQILKDPKLQPKERKKERIERLKEIVNPLFDYEEMARRSLGPHWRRRTPQEQQEFVKLFRDYLEKVYSDQVDLYAGEKVIYGRERVEDDYAQVETAFVNTKGEEVSVVYRLRRVGGKWKVYDAVVENVSVVNNYRSQFDRVISKYSFDELKRLLKEKAA